MCPPPRLVFWETTAGCNLACVHCRRLEVSRELMKNDLGTEAGLALIDQIAEVGRPLLVFSGGEPLMRPDIFELAEHAKARGLLTALATNGTMIDRAQAHRIARVGFDRVSVSLDGADADIHDQFRGLPGAFAKSMQGLCDLQAAGVATQINCTIARHNQHQLADVLELGRQMGVAAVHYFLLVPVGCGEQIAEDQMLSVREVEDRLLEIYELEQSTPLQIKATCAPHYHRIVRQQAKSVCEKWNSHPSRDREGAVFFGAKRPLPYGRSSEMASHTPSKNQGCAQPARSTPPKGKDSRLHGMTKGCLAGTAVCFVSHEGLVFPCGYLPVTAGDVRTRSFGEIWRDSPVFADLRDPDRLTGKCGRCEFKRVCGGCRARAFYEYGNYLAEEPYCAYEPKS